MVTYNQVQWKGPDYQCWCWYPSFSSLYHGRFRYGYL